MTRGSLSSEGCLSYPLREWPLLFVVLQARPLLLLGLLHFAHASLGEHDLLLVAISTKYPGLGCLGRNPSPPIDATIMRRPHLDLPIPSSL